MDSQRPDDSTHWEDQLEGAKVAYFLIPLPEPLPLPDRVRFTAADLEAQSDHLRRVAEDGADPEGAPRVEQHVSLVVHQVEARADPTAPITSLISVADTALPWSLN